MRPIIEIYNQVIKVDVLGVDVLQEALRNLCRYLTSYEVFKINNGKKLVTKVSNRYYYLSKDHNIARFSINFIRKVLDEFNKAGFSRDTVELIDMREYKTFTLKVDMNKDITPRVYQKRYIWAISGKDAKRSHLVDLPPGYGKAHSLDTLLRVPNGWKAMRDIKVNDEVISRDGTSTKVTGVYPQGVKDIYRVTFEDGRTSECCDEHLWKVYNGDKPSIINTLELKSRLKRNSCFIDLCLPEITEEKQLPLKFIDYGKYLNTNTNMKLQIHNEYLNGTVEQKTELLFGITNNIININTFLFYSSPNKEVVEYVRELVWSLGGKAYIEASNNRYVLKYIFFTQGNKYRLQVKSVELIKQAEAQCISVDHPEKLYVIENYIVTHNTLIGSYAVGRNKMLTAVLTKSGYLEKWIDDLNKYMLLEKSDIYVIQGSDSLTKLFKMDAKDIKQIKFYVMSMRTMQNYVESYMEDELSVEIGPDELLRYLGVGTVLNDESHQEFASLYKILLFLDPKRLIGLSATMESDDAKTNYMYRLIYPVEDRASNLVEYVKYINVKAISYKLAKFRIQYKTPMGYNHIKYEKSIMKYPKAIRDYMEMIAYYIETEYKVYRTENDKCLIFFGTIDICTLFTNYISKKYPSLDVRRYTQDDPYENVLEADICISTNKSAGTAVDIPNLITVIQTVSISGKQPNVQAAGRLREIEDKTMRYICLYSQDLDVHRRMNTKRRKTLESIYRTYTNDMYSKTIGNPYN